MIIQGILAAESKMNKQHNYTDAEQVCKNWSGVRRGITESKQKLLRIFAKIQYNFYRYSEVMSEIWYCHDMINAHLYVNHKTCVLSPPMALFFSQNLLMLFRFI